MAAKSKPAPAREFTLSREFNAPREAVWKAWTDGEQLARWWGPKEMKLEVVKSDIRVGGSFHYAMKAPGNTMYGLAVYRELSAPERLVWVNSFADEKGKVARAPFSKDFPLEVLNTVTFAERDGKTLLTLRSIPIGAGAEENAFFEGMFKSMEQGYGGTLDQLARHLQNAALGDPPKSGRKRSGKLKVDVQGERDVVFTRVFEAPAQLVFDAFTKPEILKKWLFGPDGWSLDVCDMDLRVGGSYRWEWLRASDGLRMGMGGKFREIKPPHRLVTTEKFDDPWYPGEAVGTIELTEAGGKTTLKQTLTYESRAAREAVLKSPMDEGVEMGYDRLEQLIAQGECLAAPEYVPTTKLSNTFKLELRGDREIYMERQFEAPKRLVFLAHSKAEHMRNWWGPRGFETTFCEIDFKVGGKWRMAHKTPDGTEYGFHGEYLEIVPNEKITWTFEFEGMPGVAVETMTLEENGGRTILRASSIAPSKEARDGMAQSGMEWGARQTWDRLDELVAKLS